MAKELTWREAIDKVLGDSAAPLHYNEISDKIIANKLRTSLGATPAATVNAQISSSIKHDQKTPYVRIAKGTFSLAKNLSAGAAQIPKEKLTPTDEESDENEEQYDIVSSFGMYWRREAIQWSASPKDALH